MKVLNKIQTKIRYGLFIQGLINRLARIGIEPLPYYIVSEGLFNGSMRHLETGFDEYIIGFLGSQDMKAIASIPERITPVEKLLSKLKEGKRCFGVKRQGELVAFTWCDFNECNCRFHRFSLKENEAYLFDAYTLVSFRGKGIAPYMRYKLYKELAKAGKHRLYSISECYNTPSIKFKKKLNAEILELGLYVELFKKWHFNTRLKKYRVPHSTSK
jgi:ribosomal protein S18 acetylase RimI-like enzyme